MQLTTTKTEQITVEIQDGYYKNGEDFVALLDEKVIRITRFGEYAFIQVYNANNASASNDLSRVVPCTKEEYENAYNEAVTFINDRLGLNHYSL